MILFISLYVTPKQDYLHFIHFHHYIQFHYLDTLVHPSIIMYTFCTCIPPIINWTSINSHISLSHFVVLTLLLILLLFMFSIILHLYLIKFSISISKSVQKILISFIIQVLYFYLNQLFFYHKWIFYCFVTFVQLLPFE